MKEQIDKLYDSLNEKLKGSFLPTFIVIWLIHHWRFIFILFNFDSYYFLDSKLIKLQSYTDKETWIGLWLCPVLWSFASIIFYYVFSSVSEFLNIKYQNVRKKIYKRWDDKKIKTIQEYLEKVQENTNLQGLVSELEKRRDSLLTINDRIEKDLTTEKTSNVVISKSVLDKDAKISSLEKLIELREKEKEEANKKARESLEEISKSVKFREGNFNGMPKISNDISDIFGNSNWNFEFINEEGKLTRESFFMSNPTTFRVKDENIELSNIKFNRIEGTVEFFKSNSKRKYTDRYTKLIIKNPDNLVGIEQNGDVKYTRSMSTPNTINIISALYTWPGGEVNVTHQIRDLINRNIYNGIVDPLTFAINDPQINVRKVLKIKAHIRGHDKEFSFEDGETFKLNPYDI
ncbi:MAG: hypothetical protein ABIP51_08765 [Bacteroidia bacterium]